MLGKILVVDDEQNMRYLLRITLRSEGFKVTTVASGPEALQNIKTEMPDLVILDILMPEMDGWQVCEELRKIASEKELSIIILSCVTPGERELEFIHKFAISDYVVKPFEPMLLFGKIKQVLGLALHQRTETGPAKRAAEGQEFSSSRYILEPPRRTPVLGQWDLVVAGGGLSGVACAVAGARNGARTLLVERNAFLGGMATMAPEGPMHSYRHNGEPLSGGIFLEVLDRMISLGGAVQPLPEAEFMTPFDPDALRDVAMGMLDEAGVELLLDSLVFDVHMDGHTIKHFLSGGKSGRVALSAPVFVDATSDANVASLAGVLFLPDVQDRGARFPVTYHIRVGGVNSREAARLRQRDFEAIDELAFEHNLPGLAGIRFYSLPRGGEFVAIIDEKGVKPDFRLSREVITFLRQCVPGFEQAYLVPGFAGAQFRNRRHILGESIFNYQADGSETPRKDGVIWALLPEGDIPCSWPRSQEEKPVALHPIALPYGALVPSGVENLLVVGQCISASTEASLVLPTLAVCVGIGQVAGTAAALSKSSRILPKNLPIGLLQRVLRNQGMVVP